MSKKENFYRRNPGDALAGMVGMSLEERGVYNTVIDLVYLTWRPLEDNRQYIAAHCGCAVQKVNPIIERLIARGKLLRFQEDGCWYISNRRFEDERSEVKGETKTRSGRGKVDEKSAGVGEKSGEVGEKSAGVSDNSVVLDIETAGNQEDRPLDRQDRPDKNPHKPPRGRDDDPDGFAEWWARYPRKVARGAAVKAYRSALKRTDGATLLRAITGRTWPDDERYVPHPATWLNGDRWLDGTATGGVAATGLSQRVSAWGPDTWASAVRIWKAEGTWDATVVGPEPGEPGCYVPPEVLRRFDIEPAPPTPVARTA